MPEILNGLLSGKYDSTKQRAVLLNGDRLRNYRSYTATMRMELLLTGRLIFTDAQFFDGLYFHWLAKNADELKAFEELLSPFADTSAGKESVFSISVKCRGLDMEQAAVSAFCKEFQFSSIEDDELVAAVFDLSKDYSEEYLTEFRQGTWDTVQKILQQPVKEAIQLAKQAPELQAAAGHLENALQENMNPLRFMLAGSTQKIRPIDETGGSVKIDGIGAYLADMKKMLESQYGEQSSISKNWERYAEGLKFLFDRMSDGKYADQWGFRQESGQWGVPAWDNINKGCLEQTVPESKGESYLEKMQNLLVEANGADGMNKMPAASRYFARIRDELNRGVTNRSRITIALDALGHLNNEPPSADRRRHSGQQYANDCFRDFHQLLNDRYNKALACQHGCKFLDLCDYTKVFTLIKNMGVRPVELELPLELVKHLAELSWRDFVTVLNANRVNLESAFNKWMTAYNNFSSSGQQQTADELRQYLIDLNFVFASAGFGKNAAITKAPWNIEGTCKDDIRAIFAQSYPTPYYLVGGGSFEPGTEEMEITDKDKEQAEGAEGNEICILCVENGTAEPRGMAVLRLRLQAADGTGKDVSEDCDLNTLLAPVCNPLNGGNLRARRDTLKKERGGSRLGAEWRAYQSLLKNCPEAFADTGNIHIVTDPALVETFQEKSGRTIGVVYSSPYRMMVVDMVYAQEGKYFAYERVLPAIRKGAVVIVPKYRGGFLLLRQYRHALRDYQYAFPRGFGEDGISAEENVCKEITEELSARASNVVFLGTCVADSGLCGDKVSVYSCDIESFSVNDGYEGISNIIHLSLEEIAQWMKSGKLNDGFTLSALSLLSASDASACRKKHTLSLK